MCIIVNNKNSIIIKKSYTAMKYRFLQTLHIRVRQKVFISVSIVQKIYLIIGKIL